MPGIGSPVVMISTVTAATIQTVTTIAIAGSVSLIGILFLLALLIQKELASSSNIPFMQRLSRILNTGIFPLLIAFVLTVVVKVADLLHLIK
jgi:hypothetical protein